MRVAARHSSSSALLAPKVMNKGLRANIPRENTSNNPTTLRRDSARWGNASISHSDSSRAKNGSEMPSATHLARTIQVLLLKLASSSLRIESHKAKVRCRRENCSSVRYRPEADIKKEPQGRRRGGASTAGMRQGWRNAVAPYALKPLYELTRGSYSKRVAARQ